MITLTANITGLVEVETGLAQLASLDIDAANLAAAEDVQAVCQVYPAPPPGSQYVRTYTLRDSWSISPPSGNGQTIEREVFNPTEYGEYVMGDAQARIHQGRWKTVDQIADEMEAKALQTHEAAIDAALRGW